MEYDKQLFRFSDADDYDKSADYFKKYWLSDAELTRKWQFIKDTIFTDFAPTEVNAIQNVFQPEFNLVATYGGTIFEEKDFLALQQCMVAVGDEYFVIVEDYDLNNPPCITNVDQNNTFCGKTIPSVEPLPKYQFIYPVGISWQELYDECSASEDLFLPFRQYYVFGDSCTWGKYILNDFWPQIDLIGVREEMADLFLRNFSTILSGQKEIIEAFNSQMRERLFLQKRI